LVEKTKSGMSLIISGIPQGSVLGPILFLIYISDIGEDLLASTLVYVDDTKVKKGVKSESDVENLQCELNKLDSWAKNNNMEFNKKKFQVLRYGANEDLKNETSYFSGNIEEVIERFETIRDLGVELSDDGARQDKTKEWVVVQNFLLEKDHLFAPDVQIFGPTTP